MNTDTYDKYTTLTAIASAANIGIDVRLKNIDYHRDQFDAGPMQQHALFVYQNGVNIAVFKECKQIGNDNEAGVDYLNNAFLFVKALIPETK